MDVAWSWDRRARATPAWPPRAARAGSEPSSLVVLILLTVGYALMLGVFALTPAGTLPSVAPYGSAGEMVTRELVVPSAIVAALSLVLVLVMGWGRASGLTVGSAAPWGVIPLVGFGLGTLAVARLPQVAANGRGLVGLVMLGLLLAAFAEEMLFRGFLLHGLTRTMGGRAAVLLGSALFAAGHIPSLVVARLEGGGIAASLVVIFGLGVLLCRIRVATGSIWLATAVHTLWNFVTVAAVGTASSIDAVPGAFVALKLVPVLVGLGLAVRLARSPRAAADEPPMPPAVLVAPVPAVPGTARPSPWAVAGPAPHSSPAPPPPTPTVPLPAPPPPRPD
jgi:membrane protease YdiL (CAAX protease family)